MLLDLIKLRLHELAIILISLWGIFDLIYAPHPHYPKEVGLFPAFRMGQYTLLISEIMVWGFVGLFFIRVLEKVVKSGRINLAPKEFSFSVLIFLFLVILSLLQGLANRNLNLLAQFRVFFPNIVILIFLNLAISSNVEKIVFKITTLGGVLILILGMINFHFPGVLNNYTISAESYDIWFALYLVVWLFSISLSRLIFFKFNIYWILLTCLSTVVVLLHLTNKPIIFATFISGTVICLLGIFSKSRKAQFRTIVYSSLGFFVLISTFYMLSDSFKNEMVQTLARRYFKSEITHADEIGHAIVMSKLGGSEKDVSGGRIDIWKSYLKLAGAGIGVSPKGLGASAQINMHGAIFEDKPVHNRFVYLAYHFGFIAALIYVTIVFRFMKNGFVIFRHFRQIDCYGFSMDKLIGIFSFIIAVIASGMVGGPVNNPRFAWFFWFFVFVILKRWQKLQLF